MKHSTKVMTSSKSVEWYTPASIVEAARRTMNGIDLDPTSCEEANKVVQATTFFTKEQDGLLQDWRVAEYTRVFMNPPYGRALPTFVKRVVHAYTTQEINVACLCVTTSPDTKWWQLLRDYPVCFIHGRVRFRTPDGDAGVMTKGTAIFYLGAHVSSFAENFLPLGDIWERSIFPTKVGIQCSPVLPTLPGLYHG